MSDEQQQLRAIVHGRVQGVSFRYYTVQAANRLGLTGWIRNEPDRSVQVVAEGTQAQLDHLVEFLHVGSPHAQVEEIYIEWDDATYEFSDFKIIYHHG